jgi:hypothetical protein
MGRVNGLGEVDLEAKPERRKFKKRRKRYAPGTKTRVAAEVRKGTRLPPPVPKNKSMAEIIVATRTMEKHVNSTERGMELYDEDRAIAEGILDLGDWDVEELVRGYRRNRDGRFGKPPKYIPREIQQAAFRALINRGDRRLKSAYYKALEELVELAHNASSEKVKLDAIKEIENRVVGKVPDKVMVSRDEPWEDILADSLVPISESIPLEMDVDEDGVARMPPVVIDEREGGVEADFEALTASANPLSEGAPSPSHKVELVDDPVDEVEVIPPTPAPRRRGKRRTSAARN